MQLKADLEMQLHGKREEVKVLERRLEALNNILADLGVKPKQGEYKRYTHRTVVRDKWGNPIVHIDVDLQRIRVTPTNRMRISVNSKLFRVFLFGRVLGPMQQEDERAVAEGALPPGEALTFKCVEKQGRLVELVVKNYRTEERLARITEALAWALGRMHRKYSPTT